MTIDSSLPVTAHSGSRENSSQVTVARSMEEVEALRGVWETIGVADIDSDIDYFLTVARNSPNVLRPHVILVQRPGRPTLMAIARLERLGIPLSVGYRTVMRPQLHAIVVTFGGLVGVAEPDDERVLAEELRRPLRTGEADMLLVRQVDNAGKLRDVFVNGVSWLRRSHAQTVTPRWVAPVPESLDAFLRSRSTKTRQTMRRQSRRLEDIYGDSLRLRRFESPDEMADLCRDMEFVASKTYQRGLGVGYSGNPLDLALIALGLRRHWYRAWILYINDHPVAFWSGNAYGKTFNIVATGFDPAYEKHAVGRYTMFRMVEDLCATDSITLLDFGHGDAEYKAAFGTAERIESDVFLVRRGLRPVTVNLAATVLFIVNGWGRRIVQKTDWGRRFKRAWQRRLAGRR